MSHSCSAAKNTWKYAFPKTRSPEVTWGHVAANSVSANHGRRKYVNIQGKCKWSGTRSVQLPRTHKFAYVMSPHTSPPGYTGRYSMFTLKNIQFSVLRWTYNVIYDIYSLSYEYYVRSHRPGDPLSVLERRGARVLSPPALREARCLVCPKRVFRSRV